MPSNLRTERDGDVLRITLARPDRRNAFDAALIAELAEAFVGAEALLERALAAGAEGAVSGLAASFPDAVVPLVREPTADAGERATALRAELQRFPFHAASKAALGFRGVPVGAEVRAPLRGLTDAERTEVERIVAAWQR